MLGRDRTAPRGRDPRPSAPLVPSVVVSMVLLSSASFVIFPLIPSLQSTLDVSTAEIGYLAAAGFGAALIAELLVAPAADRGHARLMAVAGVLLVASSLALSAAAGAGWQLIAARGLGGFGFGIFVIAASALLVRSDPTRSGELLGRLGAAELAGIAVGPLASGGALLIASPSVILAVAASAVVTALVPVLLGFREARRSPVLGDEPHPTTGGIAAGVAGFDGTDADRGMRFGSTPAPRSSLDLLRLPSIIGIVLLYAAVMVPTGAYDGIWPRYMADIGAGPLLTAASYALFALPYVLLAAWAGRLADRRGGVAAYWRGLLILLPIVGLYGIVGNPWVATGMGFVESTGQALAFIGASAAMAHAVDPARAGSAQGLLRGIGLVAATIAAAVSGLAYELGGALLLFGGTAVVVALIAAAGLLLARRPAHPTP
ncbi:MAG: MFS transporter [Microcella sp.]|uniref:MFS transporter n=1 Tax=Microcella sp. TaxID=1913979 RepID=UPI0033153BC4